MTADERLRAVIDRDECFGFGFCADHLPEVFAIDESGHGVVIGDTADLDRLRLAADDCPRGAISLLRAHERGGVARPLAPRQGDTPCLT